MELTLKDRAEEIVREALEHGDYATAEEMVEDALSFMEGLREREFTLTPEAEARVEEGIAQAERGELVDAHAALDELRNKLTRGA